MLRVNSRSFFGAAPALPVNGGRVKLSMERNMPSPCDRLYTQLVDSTVLGPSLEMCLRAKTGNLGALTYKVSTLRLKPEQRAAGEPHRYLQTVNHASITATPHSNAPPFCTDLLKSSSLSRSVLERVSLVNVIVLRSVGTSNALLFRTWRYMVTPRSCMSCEKGHWCLQYFG